MIYTYTMIMDKLSNYANPKMKLSRLIKAGQYFPIVRGLYETDRNRAGYLLAGSIYGPSYLSFDFALSYYNLIPEAAYIYTSATFDKQKTKSYKTPFGTFVYRDVPTSVFPYEILVRHEDDYAFRIASPEKALCDKLYSISPVKTIKGMKKLLEDDLRIDIADVLALNLKVIEDLAPLYRSTNVMLLAKLLGRGQA